MKRKERGVGEGGCLEEGEAGVGGGVARSKDCPTQLEDVDSRGGGAHEGAENIWGISVLSAQFAMNLNFLLKKNL